LAQDAVGKYPKPKPRKAFEEIKEQSLLLVNSEGRVFVRKKLQGQWHAGLWDLPQRADVNVTSKPKGSFDVQYVVTHHKIRREVRVHLIKNAKRVTLPGQWVKSERLKHMALGAPMKKALTKIQKSLRALD